MNLKSANEKLKSAKSEWSVKEESLEAKCIDFEQKTTDLKRQNEMLLSQLETVSVQSTKIHEFQTEDQGEGEPKKYQELIEIVRFVRREKDILQCQFDLLDHECKKLKSQSEHLQKALDSSQLLLKQVRCTSDFK